MSIMNNNSWEYKKGYEDGKKWGQYDYTTPHYAEYDAGFMAGYFEQYGYTFDGKTYSQIQAEKQAQQQQYNQFNQQYKNNPQLAQSVNIGSGTILDKIIDLLKSLLHLIFLLFIRSDEQNAQATFGSVSSGTVKLIRVMKGGVIVFIIWGIISISSLFKSDNHSDKVNENTNKTQPAEELVYSPNATKPNENKELVDAQFGDENTDKTLNETPNTTANKQANETINKGVPGVDALREPDFGPYMKEIERRIKMNWDPPKGNNSASVKTKFRIAKDGRLLSYEITQSSGIASTDRAAVNAIQMTAPFRPLPSDYKGEWIDIEFTFDYNVLRRN